MFFYPPGFNFIFFYLGFIFYHKRGITCSSAVKKINRFSRQTNQNLTRVIYLIKKKKKKKLKNLNLKPRKKTQIDLRGGPYIYMGLAMGRFSHPYFATWGLV